MRRLFHYLEEIHLSIGYFLMILQLYYSYNQNDSIRLLIWKKYLVCVPSQILFMHGDDTASDLNKKKTKKCWDEILFEMMGATWQGEGCILGYKPKSEVNYDIGFNYDVGKKWPNKAWPMEYWKEFERIIGNKYTVTWQSGLGNIEEYIEWINSCRVFITNDSLGLHIANALNKKIIALFGPTHADEVYIKDGVKILPVSNYDCIPCLNARCIQDKSCMNFIEPKIVCDSIKDFMKDR